MANYDTQKHSRIVSGIAICLSLVLICWIICWFVSPIAAFIAVLANLFVLIALVLWFFGFPELDTNKDIHDNTVEEIEE